RHLEHEIAEEEEPGAEAVGGVAQPQLALQHAAHEADVDAVDVRDDVAEEAEGDEPPRDARERAGLDVRLARRPRLAHAATGACAGSRRPCRRTRPSRPPRAWPSAQQGRPSTRTPRGAAASRASPGTSRRVSLPSARPSPRP